ncbi:MULTISPECIES: thioesterase II family protein [unclassified Sinorhizobium]|uniref:thioesterase II family protein n=1 Tax=unclassified Sinorhizobium TaxID=2613772 RepID=UPI003524012D
MPGLNLLCIPYAGGTATIYRSWNNALPPWTKVHAFDLPGHGARRLEPLVSDWSSLTGWLLRQVEDIVHEPCAIFGHSMGALLALELAHALRARGSEPKWLGISACRAPGYRDKELQWLGCPEQEVLSELRSLGGTPAELLESRELLDLVVPVIRNDFHLCGTYARPERERLKCPITVFGGTHDEDVSHPRIHLTAWQNETSGPCFLTMIDGDHFFIESRRAEVLTAIRKTLSELRAAMGFVDAC